MTSASAKIRTYTREYQTIRTYFKAGSEAQSERLFKKPKESNRLKENSKKLRFFKVFKLHVIEGGSFHNMSFENWNKFLQETLSRLSRERAEKNKADRKDTKKAARHGKDRSGFRECNTHNTSSF